MIRLILPDYSSPIHSRAVVLCRVNKMFIYASNGICRIRVTVYTAEVQIIIFEWSRFEMSKECPVRKWHAMSVA